LMERHAICQKFQNCVQK